MIHSFICWKCKKFKTHGRPYFGRWTCSDCIYGKDKKEKKDTESIWERIAKY